MAQGAGGSAPDCVMTVAVAIEAAGMPRSVRSVEELPADADDQRIEATIRPRRSMLSSTSRCSSPGHCMRMTKCRTPKASR